MVQRACICGGLRVNAVPTARNIRVATDETLYLGDWAIEPGLRPSPLVCFRSLANRPQTAVAMNMHFAQLDSDVFLDPLQLDHYRWIDIGSSSEKARIETHFHPFGKGSRICLGIEYASFSFPFVP